MIFCLRLLLLCSFNTNELFWFSTSRYGLCNKILESVATFSFLFAYSEKIINTEFKEQGCQSIKTERAKIHKRLGFSACQEHLGQISRRTNIFLNVDLDKNIGSLCSIDKLYDLNEHLSKIPSCANKFYFGFCGGQSVSFNFFFTLLLSMQIPSMNKKTKTKWENISKT